MRYGIYHTETMMLVAIFIFQGDAISYLAGLSDDYHMATSQSPLFI